MGTGAKKLAAYRGQRVGRYELIGHLARGGMAELYLARASGVGGFEKYVALKRILPKFADDPKFIRMFLNEARVAATLDHQNIGHVHDVGEADGDYFFTMEYIHGHDLRTVLRAAAGHGLPLEHSVHIAICMCAALHYAHERTGYDGTALEVVHRDVSPANVLVSYEGAVKVVDFGIARAVWEKTHTDIGEARKGKLGYMSPEQCRAEAVTRRSDIFALGILLFEMTTLTRLFRGGDEFSTMNMIVNEPIPRPSQRRPDYPKALERIVMKALAREPAERYATALDMQLDLEEFAAANGLVLSPTRLGRWLLDMLGPLTFPWDEPRRLLPLPAPGTGPQPRAASDEDAPVERLESKAIEEIEAPIAPAASSPSRRPLLIGAAALGVAALVAGLMLTGGEPPAPPQPPRETTPVAIPVPVPAPVPEPAPTQMAAAPEPEPEPAAPTPAAEAPVPREASAAEEAPHAEAKTTRPRKRSSSRSSESKKPVDPNVFMPPD